MKFANKSSPKESERDNCKSQTIKKHRTRNIPNLRRDQTSKVIVKDKGSTRLVFTEVITVYRGSLVLRWGRGEILVVKLRTKDSNRAQQTLKVEHENIIDWKRIGIS